MNENENKPLQLVEMTLRMQITREQAEKMRAGQLTLLADVVTEEGKVALEDVADDIRAKFNYVKLEVELVIK